MGVRCLERSGHSVRWSHFEESRQARTAARQSAVLQTCLGSRLVTVPTVVTLFVTAFVTARAVELLSGSPRLFWFFEMESDRGGARTHDLRIKSTKRPEDYWGPSDAKRDRKRPSSLLRIPIVPIETNGLSTFCLQWGVPHSTSLFVKRARKPSFEADAILVERRLRRRQARSRTPAVRWREPQRPLRFSLSCCAFSSELLPISKSYAACANSIHIGGAALHLTSPTACTRSARCRPVPDRTSAPSRAS
jgi:hypothetical protein